MNKIQLENLSFSKIFGQPGFEVCGHLKIQEFLTIIFTFNSSKKDFSPFNDNAYEIAKKETPLIELKDYEKYFQEVLSHIDKRSMFLSLLMKNKEHFTEQDIKTMLYGIFLFRENKIIEYTGSTVNAILSATKKSVQETTHGLLHGKIAPQSGGKISISNVGIIHGEKYYQIYDSGVTRLVNMKSEILKDSEGKDLWAQGIWWEGMIDGIPHVWIDTCGDYLSHSSKMVINWDTKKSLLINGKQCRGPYYVGKVQYFEVWEGPEKKGFGYYTTSGKKLTIDGYDVSDLSNKNGLLYASVENGKEKYSEKLYIYDKDGEVNYDLTEEARKEWNIQYSFSPKTSRVLYSIRSLFSKVA